MHRTTENAPASLGPYGASATRYGCTEDVRVVPVVVAPFKLRDVKREILAADLVEAAHDAALDEGPEAVNFGKAE